MAHERMLERQILRDGGVPLYSGDDRDELGVVRELYIDTETQEPEWAFVTPGGRRFSGTFVPLDDAEVQADHIRVPLERTLLEGAPRVPTGTRLSAEQAEAMSEYFASGARGHGGLKVTSADADPMVVESSPESREADAIVDALSRVRARIEAGNRHLNASQNALAAAIELSKQRTAQSSGQRDATAGSLP